jgi:hypothetical protein
LLGTELFALVYPDWKTSNKDYLHSLTNAGERDRLLVAEENRSVVGFINYEVDDGWFGQCKDDHAGLGDWYVNPKKFPDGLKPLIDKVHSLGMDFGLWVEPEMVNPRQRPLPQTS